MYIYIPTFITDMSRPYLTYELLITNT